MHSYYFYSFSYYVTYSSVIFFFNFFSWRGLVVVDIVTRNHNIKLMKCILLLIGFNLHMTAHSRDIYSIRFTNKINYRFSLKQFELRNNKYFCFIFLLIWLFFCYPVAPLKTIIKNLLLLTSRPFGLASSVPLFYNCKLNFNANIQAIIENIAISFYRIYLCVCVCVFILQTKKPQHETI